MNALLPIFANNILPIFLAAAGGFLLSKFLNVSPRPISQVAFYLFSPCLIFNLITGSQLGNDAILRMVGFAVAVILTLGGLAWLIGKTLQLERHLLIAVIITTMFSNAGNYGLSLNLFAFGEGALAHASLYFVTMSVLVYTVGVFVSSLGSSGIKKSLLGLFRVPAVYALFLALLFNALEWDLPLPLDRSVTLLGNAAIPTLMVLLGLQLGHAQWQGQVKALGLANLLRLVVSPGIALLFSFIFKLTGSALQAGVVESAMPTAVVVTVLATEFDIEPSFVTTVVFTSTLFSPITVTPLLAYLGA
ncbi:MAG: AEC family transporter [Anaerolineales bacterium]|nr:MAG: AEC family transporter [Anaerolineales bacterium]